jgi:integrase
VVLNDDPAWRAAMKAAQRFEKESDTNPPPPLTEEAYEEAQLVLRNASPQASLFLALMWTFAARAGDVSSLRTKDVTLLEEPDEAGRFRTTIANKRGKGARFRGPYATSSTLHLADATLLKKLLAERDRSAPLFARSDELRETIRGALRAVRREYALPSVRTGAVRHLAAQGVPEQALMKLTGHTRVETLNRYLGYGRPQPGRAAG